MENLQNANIKFARCKFFLTCKQFKSSICYLYPDCVKGPHEVKSLHISLTFLNGFTYYTSDLSKFLALTHVAEY